MEKLQPWFLHIDLDAFFASVEQLDHPEYRGKPVIVGGKPEDKRSVVSTASYEARKYGVHSAMPTAQAYKLCPNGIYVHGRMERYSQISYLIMEIIKNYSPDFLQMSIDEAFIDITGTEKLFGTPVETAQKIKNEIKEKTGLTVSIGIAPTKYLAKMASEVNKPDGLYCVEPGQEESFMLGLPIKKVFGIGDKMQESLKRSGLYTTRDIHERTIESLKFMFGENAGDFLYHAVRGQIYEPFERKTKSHSISAEKTFSYDITDLYTLETSILELCHGIMFRLLRENGFSRTAFVKIRYEDFSTVSIQKTYSKNILTLDFLYKAVKELFEEKWEKGRGVRLLGVGLENIEKEEKPYQQDLFDDGSEKRQKVEKAILNLEKKHPEIKVHKARMLENFNRTVKILIFSLCLFFAKNTLIAEEYHTVQKGAAGILPETQGVTEETEAPTQLFNWEIKGYWKANLEESFIASFGNGNSFSPSFSVPVFKQEIDLSAKFNINNQWKLLVEFLDNYDKNTFTLSYTGDKTLKTFIFSNRNIIFPDYYSVKNFNYNPAGGSNEAPGLYFHLEDYKNNKYLMDFLLRYDMTKSSSATYYGKNSVTDTKIKPEDFAYGKTFVLPDENVLKNIKAVYVQSDIGEYKDKDGIRYKKLSDSDFITSLYEKTLTLSKKAGGSKTKNKIPEILITFTDSSLRDSFISSLGSYSNASSFLGSIQAFFYSADSSLDLSKYNYEFKNEIDGKPCLKIQSSSGFSPFLYCASYDLGLTNNSSVQVVSTTDEVFVKYQALTPEKDTSFLQTNLFEENHTYVTVQNTDYLSQTVDYTKPQARYPFADIDPYVYVTGESKTALQIRSRLYTKVSYYDIGKKASQGSVKVYVNGILDKGAVYSPTSGFVTPSVNVSDIDKVYITWDDESNTYSNGAFIGGAGYVYKITDAWTFDATLTSRIPFAPFTSYATYDNNFSLYTALTGGINYNSNKIKASEALALAVENENIKNVFVLNNINADKTQIFYLSETSSHKTQVLPLLNTNSAPQLLEENNSTVQNYKGKREENLTGYKVPLEWDFGSVTPGENAWASVDIKLTDGTVLSNSSIFEIALKKDEGLNSILDSNYELYLQLGTKAEDEFTGEIKNTIPTWKISCIDDSVLEAFDFGVDGWQFIKIKITDTQRAKLISNHDARLILVKKNYNPGTDAQKGILYLGPYQPHQKSALVKANSNIFTVSTTTPADSSKAGSEYFDSYYADKVFFQNDDLSLLDSELLITVEKYFKEAGFSDYAYVNFDFSYSKASETGYSGSNETGMVVELCTAAAHPATALKLSLPAAVLKGYVTDAEKWHSIRVGLEDGSVWIDGTKLALSTYTLYIDKTVTPSCQKIIFNTALGSTKIIQGTFLAGCIYFTETKTNFLAKNHLSFDYEDKELSFKIKDAELFSKPEVHLSSMQSFTTSGNSLTAEAKAGFTSYDIKFNFDSSFATNFKDSNVLQNARHTIQTQKELFRVFNFSELYRYNAQNLLETSNIFTLDFNKINFPLSLNFTAGGQSSTYEIKQNYFSNLKFSIPFKENKIESDTTFTLSQNATSDLTQLENKDYFTGLGHIKLIEFNPGLENTLNRKTDLKSTLSFNFTKTKPVLSFNAIANYKNSNDFQSSDLLALSVPVIIGNSTLTFNLSRTAGKTQGGVQSNNYSEHLSTFFEHFDNNSLIFISLPVYDLFDSSLGGKFNGAYTSAFYSTKYDISWKRKLTNSIKDLFIPTALSLSATRDIRKTESVNDIYQLKASGMFNFVNLFGKDGKMPLAKWYNQDEYNASFTSSFVLPCGTTDKTTYLISFYESYLMYIDNDNSLKLGDDFTISNTDNWKLRFTALWNHKGSFSILYYIPKLIFKDLKEEETKITRKEILNISLGKTNAEFISSWEATHSCDYTFKKNYTVNTSLGLIYNQYEKKANTIDFKMSLGLKLLF